MSVLKEPTYVTSRSYWPSLLIAISYIPITGCPLTILATLLMDVVENNRELYRMQTRGGAIPKARLGTYLNIILGFLKKVLIPSINTRLSGVFQTPPSLSLFLPGPSAKALFLRLTREHNPQTLFLDHIAPRLE